MKVETLRLAVAALDGEYERQVKYATDADRNAWTAESRGAAETERAMRAVSEYWDSRAAQVLDAMQELEAALDETEKEAGE